MKKMLLTLAIISLAVVTSITPVSAKTCNCRVFGCKMHHKTTVVENRHKYHETKVDSVLNVKQIKRKNKAKRVFSYKVKGLANPSNLKIKKGPRIVE